MLNFIKKIIRLKNSRNIHNFIAHNYVYFGDEEKPLGWISRKFNQKHPTYSLRWASSIKGNDEFITRFKVIQ